MVYNISCIRGGFMFQHTLWFAQFLAVYASILIFYRLWKKEGLLVWTVLSVVFANIQVVKLVSLFGMEATLGNTLYVSSFFATDALSEFYGKDEAKKAMHLSLLTAVLYLVFGKFTTAFTPLPVDTVQPALAAIFSMTPRIIAASLICFWFSQTVDIWLFHSYTQKGKALWFKNLASTAFSQLIDSFLFVFIAFFGAFEGTLAQQLPLVLQIALSTYLIKMIVNILDIPFLYALRAMNKPQPKEMV